MHPILAVILCLNADTEFHTLLHTSFDRHVYQMLPIIASITVLLEDNFPFPSVD